jgi:hypothetical protein
MSRDIPSYLRLVPKPLAKCGPPRPYPSPRIPGVKVRRGGNGWWVSASVCGRDVDVWLTTDELTELVMQGAEMLKRDEGDI